MNKQEAYKFGVDGEEQAREYLEKKGMIFLRNRYRCPYGEIDLIMADGDFIVFVEVKARSVARPGTGLMAINREKQKRLAHAAIFFLRETGQRKAPVRFDVIEINREGVIHLKNAFLPNLPV